MTASDRHCSSAGQCYNAIHKQQNTRPTILLVLCVVLRSGVGCSVRAVVCSRRTEALYFSWSIVLCAGSAWQCGAGVCTLK